MRWLTRRVGGEDGSVTAEYALLILVGAAFALALYAVVSSGTVSEAFGRIIRTALSSI